MNILLIEDNPGDARLIQEFLKDTSLRKSTIIWTQTLSAGIKEYVRHSLDVILCDLSLPDSSGIETINLLLSHIKENIPVIVLTGLNNEKMGVKAISAGAQEYIIKNELTPALLSKSILYSIERQKTENRERQLTSYLKTFRGMDQLITHVQNVENLCEMACRKLIEMKDYDCVWIVLCDNDMNVNNIVFSGKCPFNQQKLSIEERYSHCNLMNCSKQIFEKKDVLLLEDLSDICATCPMKAYQNQGYALIRRLEYERTINGAIIATVPEKYSNIPEEKSLFSEIADAIAFAIHSLNLEKEKQNYLNALKESEKRYSLIAQNLPNGAVLILNDKFNIEFAQGSELENLGIINNADAMSMLDILPQSDVKQFTEHFKKTIQGNHESFEIKVKNSYFLFNTVPLTDSEIKKVLLLSVNITLQKTAEIEQQKLENKLRHSEKLEALGRLAGGIAHDFNNQLSAIVGYANLLELSLNEHPRLKDYAHKIQNSSLRSSDLTKQLLTYARKKEKANVPINLHDIIREIIQLANSTFEKKIYVDNQLKASKILTQGDPGSIQNAFLNLAINARDAMDEGGSLIIETSNINIKQNNHLINELHLAAGDYCKICFKDSGHGIKQEDLDRIFEPFFTTKEEGKGTGMGLSTVYGTIRNHNGAVSVSSIPMKGTTFTIFLPILETSDIAVQTDKKHCYSKSKEHILVVDDELDIRLMIADSMKLFGYNVHIAENGKQAIKYVKETKKLDLVILDNDMPQMSGIEAYHQIIKHKQDVKILFMSGLNKDFDKFQKENPDNIRFINKPFTLSDLSKMVHAIIHNYE